MQASPDKRTARMAVVGIQLSLPATGILVAVASAGMEILAAQVRGMGRLAVAVSLVRVLHLLRLLATTGAAGATVAVLSSADIHTDAAAEEREKLVMALAVEILQCMFTQRQQASFSS